MEQFNVKELVNKWAPILKEGSALRSSYVEKSTAIMLENQFKYLQEASGGRLNEATVWTDGAVNFNALGVQGNDADFYKIAIPMVRRTFPELIAHDLVGVQPLNAPVGLAFALRYRADQGGTGADGFGADKEVGYNYVDPRYSGNSASTTASPSGMDRATGEALGSQAGTGVGNDIGLGIGTGNHIKELSMTIDKAQVEAKTRKLRSRWSLEIAQDLKYMHGLNIEEEMLDVLSYEITAEIDRELIAVIRKVAASNANSQTVDYLTLDGRWEAEKYRNLYNLLIRKSNTIAITTRRGAGNWVVADPNASAALEALSAFTVAPVNSDVTTTVQGVSKIGSLDGRLMVYRDTFWYTNQLLVGFKGSSPYDTGIVYLPYIQLLVSKATFENSFNPTVGLMSRYAIHEHMFGASNYYVKIDISNLNVQANHLA